ncbi:MAG: M6 family metalloprotease domain-containing protein [Bacteroidales bacterium]|nr:M6 family metalloprotease domain-containing protein [Bacteroidales bacterium]
MTKLTQILTPLLGAAALCAPISSLAAGEMLSPTDGFGKISYFTCPASGEMRFPVIFVEYQDLKFSDFEATKAHFEAKFNQEGYTDNGGPGSVRDYFVTASNGRFTPIFDFYGLVTLENGYSYYGKNNSSGADSNSSGMVIDGYTAMQDEIDFSLYDSDGDGYVDDVIVVYAGDWEYNAGSDHVLPKSYTIQYDKYNDSQYNQHGLQLGDYYINSYTVINELRAGAYDGIGTFVHEFMHGLGLADVYSTWDQAGAPTPGYYDVMDIGIYNNNSLTPPTPSAFERFSLGWMELEIIDGPANLVLNPLIQSAHAYVIPITDTEMYILENRQQESWDAYIPGHGMLIWHIDYKSSTWYSNIANKNTSHQRIDLVEACGETHTPYTTGQCCAFPGSHNVTEFTEDTTPAMFAWTEDPVPYPITDIQEDENGVITAKVCGGLNSINSAISDSDANAPVQLYDLQGRPIPAGVTPAPGIYIQRQGSRSTKVRI